MLHHRMDSIHSITSGINRILVRSRRVHDVWSLQDDVLSELFILPRLAAFACCCSCCYVASLVSRTGESRLSCLCNPCAPSALRTKVRTAFHIRVMAMILFSLENERDFTFARLLGHSDGRLLQIHLYSMFSNADREGARSSKYTYSTTQIKRLMKREKKELFTSFVFFSCEVNKDCLTSCECPESVGSHTCEKNQAYAFQVYLHRSDGITSVC